MRNQAHIRDLHVLTDLKIAFGRFGEGVTQVLPSIQKQVEEVQEWLEERRTYWCRQVEIAQEKVYTSRQALTECKDLPEDEEGDSPDCAFEEDAVSDAETLLIEYEENLEKVKQWQHRIDGLAGDFQKDIHRLSNLASSHINAAQAFLAKKIAILHRYMDGTTPMVGISGLRNQSGNAIIAKDAEIAPAVIRAYEDRLAKRVDTEKLVVFDACGNVLLERVGDQRSVPIWPNDRHLLKDAILTHNHPSGRSFSSADLHIAESCDIAELRAVGVAQPYTYVLKRPKSGWPKSLAPRYAAVINEVEEEISLKVERGNMTVRMAEQTLAHESMLRLASQLELDYERISRA